jgi:protein-tyrosine phosphatase
MQTVSFPDEGHSAGGRDRAGHQDRPGERLAAPQRRIPLAGLFNLRDLGGYPTRGGRVPWRVLFRSDALHQLDDGGVAGLAALHLRTIVDLRTHGEVEIAPSPLDALSARHSHVSLLGGDMESLPLELDAIYRYMVDECGDAIADAIRPMCSDGGFPALVHCSAGKDRTGIVIAMVLAVLGTPDEVIAEDYSLSADYLNAQFTPAIGQLQAGTGLGEQLTGELLSSPPHLILGVLARARQTHGSIESYLLAHGLTADDLATLRSALSG